MKTKLGELVHKHAKKRNMTITTLADRLGTSTPYLSAVIHGKKNATNECIQKLCDILELNDDDRKAVTRAADVSRTSYRIHVADLDESLRRTVAEFAHVVGSNGLGPDKAKKIMAVLAK